MVKNQEEAGFKRPMMTELEYDGSRLRKKGTCW